MKLLVCIFPGSDLEHKVMTPLIQNMCQYLSFASIRNERDLLSGLFICDLLHATQELSKRYIPQVFNFLYSILFSFIQVDVPSNGVFLRTHVGFKNMLNENPTPSQDMSLLFNKMEWNGSDKCGLFVAAVGILSRFFILYSELPSFKEITFLFQKWIQFLPQDCHLNVKDCMKQVENGIHGKSNEKREPLVMQKRKPIPIPTYEPAFQEYYSIDKRYHPNRDTAEMAKLKFQYKKEKKGALRELRKDADFKAREKLKDIKQKDLEYKQKIDKIMGHLASQEGSMRGYEREAKKSKRK